MPRTDFANGRRRGPVLAELVHLTAIARNPLASVHDLLELFRRWIR